MRIFCYNIHIHETFHHCEFFDVSDFLSFLTKSYHKCHVGSLSFHSNFRYYCSSTMAILENLMRPNQRHRLQATVRVSSLSFHSNFRYYCSSTMAILENLMRPNQRHRLQATVRVSSTYRSNPFY